MQILAPPAGILKKPDPLGINYVRNQVARFLCLYEPDDWVELRPLPSSRLRTWHLAGAVDAIVREALRLSEGGENIYFGVNPRKGYGRAGADGVLAARSIFVDFDEEHLTAKTLPEQVTEVLARITKAKMPPPSMIVASGHGLHFYWRLAVSTGDMDEWELMLDALVSMLGSCVGAKGRERIMRVPGFVNWKPPVAHASIVECHPNRQYEWAGLVEIIAASIPPLPPIANRVEHVVMSHAGRTQAGNRTHVIDEFNRQISITEILEGAGYRVVGKYFRRPGKADHGYSGIVRKDKRGRLVSAHWSSNDVLNTRDFGGGTCSICDAFDAYAKLEHNGDVKAAVKAAARELGIELPKQKHDDQVLHEIGESADCGDFGECVFADPFTADHRRRMTVIIQKHTSNPFQLERLLAMPAGARA